MYRERIYASYVQGHRTPLAPATVADLKPRAAYLNRLIRKHFPKNKEATIVDLGCGHGAMIYFARQNGYRNIIGFDRSPQQIAEARRLGIEGVNEGELLTALQSFGDQSVDAVVAFDVIEHFAKDELIRFADEVYRVLRPGGRWIIHTPNGESPFSGRARYGDLTHELAFTTESIGQLLFACGFTEVACYEDEPIPHGVKSAARWLLWKVVRAVLRAYLVVETGSGWRNSVLTQNFLTVAIK